MARPVLLLDVMDTLVYDPWHAEVPAMFGLSLEELLAQKHPTAWQEFELGRIDELTFAARYFADGRGCDPVAFKACLRGAYRWLDGVEDLLAELEEGGVAMHALSNYPLWFELIEERLNLSRYLDWDFVSCRTEVRKPDHEAYLGAARQLGVAPGECLFVDDKVRNVEGARAVGMPAILFEGAAQLRRELAAFGLL